jgi:predicted TIM-barrel fold metal-dependent hydrolase
MTGRRRIDTHQHIVPDYYVEWLSGHGLGTIGDRPQPGWTEGSALEFMDAMDIETAVLSLATPNVYVGPAEERLLMARRVNDTVADLARERQDRFGNFASLPLPDLNASMHEAERAIDELGADGIIVLSHVDGTYISDPSFEPILELLDDRSSVLFVHPNIPPFDPMPGVNPGAADFLLETVRAAIGLSIADVPGRFPNLSIILSHGGGFMPFAAERFAAVCGGGDTELGLARLKSFYVDTALSSGRASLDAIRSFVDPERILFGSDWPWAPLARAGRFTELLDGYGLPAAEDAAIARRNAERLMPRLARG